jgi:hypothetical protein
MFSAASLRAGFLTSAARRGASVFKMRDVSRHKSMDVLQAYVRDADLFRDHTGAGCFSSPPLAESCVIGSSPDSAECSLIALLTLSGG